MQEKCWSLFTFQWNGGALLALGIHSAGPVHLGSDSSNSGETKWPWDRRGGNRLESPTDTQKVEECWPVLYPPSSIVSQHQSPGISHPSTGNAALPAELPSEKLPLHWYIFLLKVTWWIYWVLYIMCHIYTWFWTGSLGESVFCPWDLVFLAIATAGNELNQSADSSRCKKKPFKNNHGGSYLVFWGWIIVGNFIWLLDSTYLRYLCVFHYHGIWGTRAQHSAHPMSPVHRAAAPLTGFALEPSENLQLLLWFYLESKAQVPHMFLTSGKLAALQFSWALLPFPSPHQHNF